MMQHYDIYRIIREGWWNQRSRPQIRIWPGKSCGFLASLHLKNFVWIVKRVQGTKKLRWYNICIHCWTIWNIKNWVPWSKLQKCPRVSVIALYLLCPMESLYTFFGYPRSSMMKGDAVRSASALFYFKCIAWSAADKRHRNGCNYGSYKGVENYVWSRQ